MARKKKPSSEEESWSMGRDGEENPEEGYESPEMGRNSDDSDVVDENEEDMSEVPEEVGAFVLGRVGGGTAASAEVVGGDGSDEEEDAGEERKGIPEVVGGRVDDNHGVVDEQSVLEGLETYRKEKAASPDDNLKFQLLKEEHSSKVPWKGGDGSKKGDGGILRCSRGTREKEYFAGGKVKGSNRGKAKVAVQQEKEKHGKSLHGVGSKGHGSRYSSRGNPGKEYPQDGNVKQMSCEAKVGGQEGNGKSFQALCGGGSKGDGSEGDGGPGSSRGTRPRKEHSSDGKAKGSNCEGHAGVKEQGEEHAQALCGIGSKGDGGCDSLGGTRRKEYSRDGKEDASDEKLKGSNSEGQVGVERQEEKHAKTLCCVGSKGHGSCDSSRGTPSRADDGRDSSRGTPNKEYSSDGKLKGRNPERQVGGQQQQQEGKYAQALCGVGSKGTGGRDSSGGTPGKEYSRDGKEHSSDGKLKGSNSEGQVGVEQQEEKHAKALLCVGSKGHGCRDSSRGTPHKEYSSDGKSKGSNREGQEHSQALCCGGSKADVGCNGLLHLGTGDSSPENFRKEFSQNGNGEQGTTREAKKPEEKDIPNLKEEHVVEVTEPIVGKEEDFAFFLVKVPRALDMKETSSMLEGWMRTVVAQKRSKSLILGEAPVVIPQGTIHVMTVASVSSGKHSYRGSGSESDSDEDDDDEEEERDEDEGGEDKQGGKKEQKAEEEGDHENDDKNGSNDDEAEDAEEESVEKKARKNPAVAGGKGRSRGGGAGGVGSRSSSSSSSTSSSSASSSDSSVEKKGRKKPAVAGGKGRRRGGGGGGAGSSSSSSSGSSSSSSSSGASSSDSSSGSTSSSQKQKAKTPKEPKESGNKEDAENKKSSLEQNVSSSSEQANGMSSPFKGETKESLSEEGEEEASEEEETKEEPMETVPPDEVEKHFKVEDDMSVSYRGNSILDGMNEFDPEDPNKKVIQVRRRMMKGGKRATYSFFQVGSRKGTWENDIQLDLGKEAPSEEAEDRWIAKGGQFQGARLPISEAIPEGDDVLGDVFPEIIHSFPFLKMFKDVYALSDWSKEQMKHTRLTPAKEGIRDKLLNTLSQLGMIFHDERKFRFQYGKAYRWSLQSDLVAEEEFGKVEDYMAWYQSVADKDLKEMKEKFKKKEKEEEEEQVLLKDENKDEEEEEPTASGFLPKGIKLLLEIKAEKDHPKKAKGEKEVEEPCKVEKFEWHPYLSVRRAASGGAKASLGLFAEREFGKGQLIGFYVGKKIWKSKEFNTAFPSEQRIASWVGETKEPTTRIPRRDKDGTAELVEMPLPTYGSTNYLYMGAHLIGECGDRKPNVAFHQSGIFVANKKINKNTELLVEWNSTGQLGILEDFVPIVGDDAKKPNAKSKKEPAASGDQKKKLAAKKHQRSRSWEEHPSESSEKLKPSRSPTSGSCEGESAASRASTRARIKKYESLNEDEMQGGSDADEELATKKSRRNDPKRLRKEQRSSKVLEVEVPDEMPHVAKASSGAKKQLSKAGVVEDKKPAALPTTKKDPPGKEQQHDSGTKKPAVASEKKANAGSAEKQESESELVKEDKKHAGMIPSKKKAALGNKQQHDSGGTAAVATAKRTHSKKSKTSIEDKEHGSDIKTAAASQANEKASTQQGKEEDPNSDSCSKSTKKKKKKKKKESKKDSEGAKGVKHETRKKGGTIAQKKEKEQDDAGVAHKKRSKPQGSQPTNPTQSPKKKEAQKEKEGKKRKYSEKKTSKKKKSTKKQERKKKSEDDESNSSSSSGEGGQQKPQKKKPRKS